MYWLYDIPFYQNPLYHIPYSGYIIFRFIRIRYINFHFCSIRFRYIKFQFRYIRFVLSVSVISKSVISKGPSPQGRLSSEGVSVSRVEIFSRREPKPDWGLEGRTERRKRATYPKGTISKRRQIGRISPTDFLLRRSCGGRFRQRVNEVKNEADSGADDKFRSLSPAICTRSNPSSGYEYE